MLSGFGSRSGPTFCRSLFGSKLFAKRIRGRQVAAGRQKLPLTKKELTEYNDPILTKNA